MTNELLATTTTGQTLYVLLFDATGNVYNGSTFEAPADANWSTYDIAMTEAGTTGIYRASMPAVAAGAYSWLVYKQAGVSPAVGDTVIGSGTIRWTGTAEEAVPPAANVTMWKGEDAGSIDDLLLDMQAELALIDGIKAKTDLITTGLVTVTSPVTSDGDVTVYQGDDYHNGDGCALAWSSSSWPDLTGAAVALTVKAPSGELLTVVGSAVDPGTATQTVRVELTAAETATLVAWPGPSTVRMRATLSNGRVRTLVDSKLAAIEALA